MASSDAEIKDGFTLPVWMKSKPTKDFETFASSPPAPEDSFFYIRYPKTDVLFGKSKIEEDVTKLYADQTKASTSLSFNTVKEKDWPKDTKSCQDVLQAIAPINTAVKSITSKAKQSTDDEFKGEGAACGSSVAKVAHQMISRGQSSGSRGFTVALPTDDEGDELTAPGYYRMGRRGSKSLPASPAHSPPGSPTSRRRMTGNRYFTSPFEPVEDLNNRSWLSMALLGFKKDINASTSTLAEEDTLEIRLHGNLAESVESLGPAPPKKEPKKLSHDTSSQKLSPPQTAHTFRPKPSELREMNFWSPTSM